jgi:hypothetical protein
VAPRIHVPPVEPIAVDEIQVGDAEADGAVTDAVDAEPPSTDGAPKRKRTRRGTRGGRKRRKPATNGAAAEADADSAPEPAAVPNADPEPEEYVPMSEWIEDFERREQKAG